MHVDRKSIAHGEIPAALISYRPTGVAALPEIPATIAGLLRPQEESLRFTETSYYVVEVWRPRDMTAEQTRMVREYLEVVERILAPSEKGRLLTRVLALLSHYRSDPNPPEVEFMIAEDWAEDLGEFPAWVVDEAARQWRRSRKFKPQICEIRDACLRIVGKEMKLLERLRSLVGAEAGRHHPGQHRIAGLAANLAAVLSR